MRNDGAEVCRMSASLSNVTPTLVDLAQAPPEFDPAAYRALHSDLWYLDDAALAAHYERAGRAEGRRAHPIATREAFRDLAATAGRILEIGPFFRPLCVGPNVRYFDILDREGLLRKAEGHGFFGVAPPEIDFVSADGDLGIVQETFDVVLSSHAIEHQPDLVAHLQQVERLLAPGGCYFLFVPDKRFCLDHFMPESTIADVLEAAIDRRRRHTLRTVVRHDTMQAHNDSFRHWQGDHGEPLHLDADGIAAAMEEFARGAASGEYLDRHAWQFTPRSFRAILELLNALGMVRLAPFRVFDTLAGHNEFWAILRTPDPAP